MSSLNILRLDRGPSSPPRLANRGSDRQTGSRMNGQGWVWWLGRIAGVWIVSAVASKSPAGMINVGGAGPSGWGMTIQTGHTPETLAPRGSRISASPRNVTASGITPLGATGTVRGHVIQSRPFLVDPSTGQCYDPCFVECIPNNVRICTSFGDFVVEFSEEEETAEETPADDADADEYESSGCSGFGSGNENGSGSGSASTTGSPTGSNPLAGSMRFDPNGSTGAPRSSGYGTPGAAAGSGGFADSFVPAAPSWPPSGSVPGSWEPTPPEMAIPPFPVVDDPTTNPPGGRPPGGDDPNDRPIVDDPQLTAPEPSTFALLGLGGLGLASRALRRRRTRTAG